MSPKSSFTIIMLFERDTKITLLQESQKISVWYIIKKMLCLFPIAKLDQLPQTSVKIMRPRNSQHDIRCRCGFCCKHDCTGSGSYPHTQQVLNLNLSSCQTGSSAWLKKPISHGGEGRTYPYIHESECNELNWNSNSNRRFLIPGL